MTTIAVGPRTCAPADFQPVVDWLRAGGVVAFPTDTLYGLAVDPASSKAVQRLFELKRREPRAAVPLVAASIEQVEEWSGQLGTIEAALARTFWPGPLSLVRDAPAEVAFEVHAGRRTIAIRVPSSRVAQMLCLAWRGPLTATSANYSGAPPASSVDMLGDLVGDPHLLVIDGGVTIGGAPSTIVDARDRAPILIREGAIAWNRVLESLKE